MIAGVVEAGLVIVDKPGGMTSHDVVARLRRILRTRRIGHAGTLDPMATGVLVCGVDRATKLMGHLLLETKAYRATIRLGASTTTDDAQGEVLAEVDAYEVTAADIEAGIDALTGDIMQVPSSVSAVKIGGRRAYERVRSGETVELAARPVTVSRFEISRAVRHGTYVDLDADIECSSGTYVRALARDLGTRLGVGGHLTELRRTRVGDFDIGSARTLEQLEADPALSLDLDAAVRLAFAVRDVDDEQARLLSHGMRLAPAGLTGTYAAADPSGRVIALLAESEGRAAPVLVLRPAGQD